MTWNALRKFVYSTTEHIFTPVFCVGICFQQRLKIAKLLCLLFLSYLISAVKPALFEGPSIKDIL